MSRSLAVLATSLLLSCTPPGPDLTSVEIELEDRIYASGAEVGLYYRSLGAAADSVTIGADVRMHAASTMKVPVMMQLYRDHAEGTFDLDAPVEVTTTFHSILDGSPYVIDVNSDSDQELYDSLGVGMPARDLIERMIILSSNLATNLLIRDADAERVTASMRALGADSIEVLRGVEDIPAFRAGLSNTTTARDLGAIMSALAMGKWASEDATREMVGVLGRQHYRSQIPAGLPEGTRVANKTGWITGITHDAAIVYPESRDPYVLVILIRGLAENQGDAEVLAADLSRIVWEGLIEPAR